MSTINLLELIPDDRIKILGAADLQLERLPALVYPDEADAEKRAYASGVLRAPLCRPENISHRRDIARDFLASGDLLDRLEQISAGAGEYRKAWQEDRKQLFAELHSEDGANLSDIEGKFAMLKLNLRSFLKLSERLKELIDILASSTLYAEGLLEFKETCIKLYASHAFSSSSALSRTRA